VLVTYAKENYKFSAYTKCLHEVPYCYTVTGLEYCEENYCFRLFLRIYTWRADCPGQSGVGSCST